MDLYGSCNHDGKHTNKTKDKEPTNSNVEANKGISTNTLSHPWTVVIKLFVMTNLMKVCIDYEWILSQFLPHNNKYYTAHNDMLLLDVEPRKFLFSKYSQHRTPILRHCDNKGFFESAGWPRKTIPGFDSVVTRRKKKKEKAITKKMIVYIRLLMLVLTLIGLYNFVPNNSIIEQGEDNESDIGNECHKPIRTCYSNERKICMLQLISP